MFPLHPSKGEDVASPTGDWTDIKEVKNPTPSLAKEREYQSDTKQKKKHLREKLHNNEAKAKKVRKPRIGCNP